MSSSATGTATQSSSYSRVLKVTRKVQSDVIAIHDTYGHFSEDYARELISDLRVLLDEEVLTHVYFIWTKPGTNTVLDAIRYRVITGSSNLADDRPGGITYNPAVQNAHFSMRVTYNARWCSLSAGEKQAIQDQLYPGWSTGGALNYGTSTYEADRTYSADGQYGLGRDRLRS